LFIVTYVSILTSNTSKSSHESSFNGLWNAPLPLLSHQQESAISVYNFRPGTFSVQEHLSRPVSYYAFFKGWLLLSQPPGCLGVFTSFPT